MPLTFNLRHLDKRDLHLEGELSAEDLDLGGVDELVRLEKPVEYDLTAERLTDSILVRGHLRWSLDCQCARCLASFDEPMELMDWTVDLPLTGEDSVPVDNDCVDLTPYVREDIFLAFPRHPLCGPDCQGLKKVAGERPGAGGSAEEQANDGSAAWSELNKLKF
jgi:uncharacterized protein